MVVVVLLLQCVGGEGGHVWPLEELHLCYPIYGFNTEVMPKLSEMTKLPLLFMKGM